MPRTLGRVTLGPMEEIFRSELAVVTREAGFIRVRRTSVAMREAGPKGAVDFAERFRFIVPLRERRHLGFLLDTRAAPIVGDDSLFIALRERMQEMVLGFARIGILVQTAVGKLQATRRAREGGIFGLNTVEVFGDEEEAIAYVTGRDG